MKWVSHGAIGVSICAIFNPAAGPAALLGSTAPDWLEWVLSGLRGRKTKHRGSTHYLVTWVMLAIFAATLWDWNNMLYWFAIGGVTHWVGDALTMSGVPLGWWSDRRVHLAGGRMRTGSGAEYTFVLVFVFLMCLIIWSRSGTTGFIPYFYQWGGYYQKGYIDGAEWRAHRFDFI